MHEEDGSVLDECETLYVCTVTQRRAASGCFGFSGAKGYCGGSSHGFWDNFNLTVVRGIETLYLYGNGMIAQNYRRVDRTHICYSNLDGLICFGFGPLLAGFFGIEVDMLQQQQTY